MMITLPQNAWRVFGLGLILVAGLTTPITSATAADDALLPEGYQLITRRNIFDPERREASARPTPTDEPSGPTEPPAPAPQQLRLTGVVVLDQVAMALFAGPSSELSGTRKVGDTIAGFELRRIDTQAVVLVDGERELRVPVGGGLQGRPETGWTLVESVAATAAPASGAGTDSGASVSRPDSPSSPTGDRPAAGGGSDSRAELLRRLRERRQQELGQ